MLSATKKWLLQKISSVVMVPFMIWFLINFTTIFNANYDQVISFFTSQPSKILFSIFILTMFFHSSLSISEIFEDYIKRENVKKYANISVFLSSLIIPLITIFTIISL
tara:strand:- start:6878 stop:7201 length:324 start_codon:yes stop_codon:yes gene_type:complete